MQWWKKAIIYTVAILIIYFSGFFTRYGIERKRASKFNIDSITDIEATNDRIREGITSLSSFQLIIDNGIANSQSGINRSLVIIAEASESNNSAIDRLREANGSIDYIEQRLNELHSLQLETKKD